MLRLMADGQILPGLLEGFQLDSDPPHFDLPVHSAVVVNAAVYCSRRKVSRVVDLS